MLLWWAGDWAEGVVPGGSNFPDILQEHYGKYFDCDGILIEGRKENYDAFLYYLDRILPSVSADVTKYHGETRCIVPLSAVFKTTDEAFALLMVINYFERWVKIVKDELDNKENSESVVDRVTLDDKRKRFREFKGKYTSSCNGLVRGGWDDKGIQHYNELCQMVKEIRQDKTSREMLDEKIKNHWRGIHEESEGMKKKKARLLLATRIVPFEDDDV